MGRDTAYHPSRTEHTVLTRYEIWWATGAVKADPKTDMADRYSFARCERQYEVREELITIVRKAVEITKIETKDTDPEWGVIFENWPKGAEGRLLCSSTFPFPPSPKR